MSAVIDNDYQTSLLFKQFTGVAATQLDQQFSNEPYRAIKNIFSRDIFIEEVPTEAPISIFNLDNSGDWQDSSGASSSINSGSGTSFSQIYPDSHLEYYKNVELTAVPGSNSRVWYKLDSCGNNILSDTMNFKFDDINSTYLMRVKYKPTTTYINNAINSYPLFWVLDNQSGYLQLYSTTSQLASNANIPTNPPKISYFKYVGKKGLLNLDISGQQQVTDISGLDLDVSNIMINLDNLNRMILPDGYVDISGTNYDLCGNEAIRTYYQYCRNNTFIGYPDMPFLDGSAVDHTGDPSHNNIIYELDVSGNTHLNGKLVSGFSVDSSGNYSVGFGGNTKAYGDYSFSAGLGTEASGRGSFAQGFFTKSIGTESHSEGFTTEAIGNYSHAKGQNTKAIGNFSHSSGIETIIGEVGGTSIGKYNDISNNVLLVVGCGTSITSRKDSLYITANDCVTHINKKLDVSGDLVVSGHSQLQDVSCSNLDVFGILNMTCNNIIDVSNIYFCNNTAILGISNGILTISGDLDMSMNQIIQIADATDNSGAPSWGQVQALVSGGSGSYWIQIGSDIYYNTGNVGIGTSTPSQRLEVSGNAIIDGTLDMSCNNIIDVSGVYFCNNTAILGISNGILTISGDLNMSMNQIIKIADATDNSGAPSWGQVQALVSGESGSYWIQIGSDIYYNTGNVGIGTSTPSQRLEVSGNAIIDGTLDMSCNNIIDVSGVYFCNNTAILGISNGILTISGDLDMSMNQIIQIADATDNSGAPSWGQVQALVSGGSGSYWIQIGSDIYYNTGNVGINTTTPSQSLDVSGSTNVAENLFVSMSPTQSIISTDKNLYTRNTNLIDTLKISYKTFYNEIWKLMIQANENGIYNSPSTGIIQTLSTPNSGKPQAVPTFSSAWGPCVIPIAYLDINQNYIPTPFAPNGGQPFQTAFRPHIANTTAYFTIKFAEPYDAPPAQAPPIDWKIATLYKQFNGSMKSGLGAIPEQTITFMVGYTDSYQLSAPTGGSADIRNPKPFIKIISTNIGNLKCLTGITVIPDPVNPTIPANINDLTQNMKYYGFDILTPKIGGICRIIIAESCPGAPANKEIQNKAWLLLEQQWNVEPWQGAIGALNEEIIKGLVENHIIDVRMYANNLGDLNSTRNPPNSNEYNTDWQLVSEKQIDSSGIYSWEKFVLPMGSYAVPQVFNTPTSPPVTDISYTLMVGGTPCPNPITGNIDFYYPTIVDGANLWEVWLNLKNWPYGITTTEEVFENNVDIYGNLIVNGIITAQDIIANDIFCQNIDVFNSIDVGPALQLGLTENSIISSVTATSWAPTLPGIPVTFNPGLKLQAENFYFDCTSTTAIRGFIISLADNTSNTVFRIVDNNNNYSTGSGNPPLFQVEGSGPAQTQKMIPWIDMCYNLGANTTRYKNLYVGNIDSSGNVDISGNLTIDGLTTMANLLCNDISANDISTNDIFAANIYVSNNLDVDGLITGIADTTFVEYRNFSANIPENGGDAWHCIATCEGSLDNARGLFIIDDDTSGIREQIIFYAGTTYSRGNYINVLAHNWFKNGESLTTNLRIDISGSNIYAGSNLYLYRKNSINPSDIHIRLYQNGRVATTGGRWVLTSTPITNLDVISVDLDITYNPNGNQANACSTLDYSFKGDVSMNMLSLTNLEVENTIKTKILEVEDSTGNDLLKVDGPNKTTTFNFDSSNANSGYLILKDNNASTSTFIKQQGTTLVMEGSDLQVGSVGVEKDINAAEVTGWFNTRDYYAVAKVVGVDSGGGMPQPLYMSIITNNCPGSIQLIPTTTTNSIQPQATGVYTVTITGVWTGTGNGWNDNSDTGQPMILMYGPAYHSSAPGGITQTQLLSLQSSSRFYNSGYTDYLTFNWTGRMIHQYNSAQAHYSLYCKENGGGSTGTQTYTGQIQVTRIC